MRVDWARGRDAIELGHARTEHANRRAEGYRDRDLSRRRVRKDIDVAVEIARAAGTAFGRRWPRPIDVVCDRGNRRPSVACEAQDEAIPGAGRIRKRELEIVARVAASVRVAAAADVLDELRR